MCKYVVFIGYADSTQAVLSEEGVVLDCIQVYRWLLTKTKAKIYVWGHSLGTALSTHTVARLRDENVVPAGLILEAPFTNMREELLYNFLSKVKYKHEKAIDLTKSAWWYFF